MRIFRKKHVIWSIMLESLFVSSEDIYIIKLAIYKERSFINSLNNDMVFFSPAFIFPHINLLDISCNPYQLKKHNPLITLIWKISVMFNKKKVEAVVNKTTYKPCTKKTRHVEVGIKCFTIRASVFSN